MIAPQLTSEAQRLADLRTLHILDTPPEERFDRIVRLASIVFEVPIVYVAMIDEHRQWFKARRGLPMNETSRDISFCTHVIDEGGPLIVTDASQDLRFAQNPLVTGKPHIRFYAGHPLRGPGGYNIGTFCIADQSPRVLTDQQLEVFKDFAAVAAHELSLVQLIDVQTELLRTKDALMVAQDQLAEELADAADYVQSLLPARLDGPVRTDWMFQTSSQLGGDLFGYHWLDDDRFAIYLFDVCGHGVGASLLASTVLGVLQSEGLPDTDFGAPDEVLAALNIAFPMESHDDKFFTIWYGVYDRRDRMLRCASAGHPPAIAFNGDPRAPQELAKPGLVIGVAPDATFHVTTARMGPGARLYVFSDGAYEIRTAPEQMLDLNGLVDVLRTISFAPRPRVHRVLDELRMRQVEAELRDDVSLLEIEFD